MPTSWQIVQYLVDESGVEPKRRLRVNSVHTDWWDAVNTLSLHQEQQYLLQKGRRADELKPYSFFYDMGTVGAVPPAEEI